MKVFKKCFGLISFFFIIIYGCGSDDITQPTNSIEFTHSNIKPLNQNIEGVYEAWISFQTSLDHDDQAYRSLGRFNISSNGSIVDTSGNPFTPNISRITSISLTEDALITIEPPGDNDTLPGNIRLLGGTRSQQGSSVVFNLTMNFTEILGNIASQFSTSTAKYLLASPTTGDTNQFNRGVWFSQNLSGSVPGLTLGSIPDTMDWTYQAWVIDSRDSLNYIYNIGRFDAPNERDNNQQCEQIQPVEQWNLPGHDWIQANCPSGLPEINSSNPLNNGFFRLLVTLEPRFEQGIAISKPFYIKLFYGNLEPSSYGTVLNLANVSAACLPSAVIRLSTN